MEEASVVLHADTLFSALALALAELGYDLNGLFARFPRYEGRQLQPGEPPFWLSSAFPFSGGVYFYPRPLLRPPGLDEEGSPRLGKSLKRVQFISQAVFQTLIAGRPLAGEWLEQDPRQPDRQRLRPELLAQGGRILLDPGESGQLAAAIEAYTGKRQIWTEGPRPAVTVDRASSRSQVFATGQVRFAPASGLFFLARYADLSWRAPVEQALRMLGDAGLGGERSRGHGQFDLEIDQAFTLAEPQAPDAYTTLAPLWLSDQDAQAGLLASASYGLLGRRGWVGAPGHLSLTKRSLFLLAEGSVFRQLPAGALVDVRPLGQADKPPLVQHPVWQYGLGFPVGCRLAGDRRP
jgi:CRISPR-associated protein Csm4